MQKTYDPYFSSSFGKAVYNLKEVEIRNNLMTIHIPFQFNLFFGAGTAYPSETPEFTLGF